jgi:hypothetical protein
MTFRRVALQQGRRFLRDNLEICAQLAKDLCKRVSVAAHQRIGRCAPEFRAPCKHAFEHCFRVCAGLID